MNKRAKNGDCHLVINDTVEIFLRRWTQNAQNKIQLIQVWCNRAVEDIYTYLINSVEVSKFSLTNLLLSLVLHQKFKPLQRKNKAPIIYLVKVGEKCYEWLHPDTVELRRV